MRTLMTETAPKILYLAPTKVCNRVPTAFRVSRYQGRRARQSSVPSPLLRQRPCVPAWPPQSLCAERYADWDPKFQALQLSAVLLTADTDNDNHALQRSSIMSVAVLTPPAAPRSC